MIMNIDSKLVGSLIKDLRLKFSIDQQKLAKVLGVSKSSISQWENGKGIKTENLYDIAKYFNISVSELINGRLNEETLESYLERNYDLNNHSDFSFISDKNKNEVMDYLSRCGDVIRRLMFLCRLPSRTIKEDEEYIKLSSYFDKDCEYANPIFVTSYEYDIVSTIEEIKDFYETIDDQKLDYELQKIYSLDIEINPSVIFASNDEEVINAYLLLLTQHQKDELLTNLVNSTPTNKIESDIGIKYLINSGAMYLFNEKSFEKQPIESLVYLNEFEGKHVVNQKLTEVYKDYFKDLKEKQLFDENIKPLWWKKYTKKGYLYLVDKQTTQNLYNLVNVKNDFPIDYYHFMLERDEEIFKQE